MWKRVDVSKQQQTSIKKGLQTRARKASLLRSFAWVYLWQAEIRGTASAPPTQKTEEEIVPFLSFVHNKQQWLTVLDFSLSLHFLHISLALSYLIPRQTMPPPQKKRQLRDSVERGAPQLLTDGGGIIMIKEYVWFTKHTHQQCLGWSAKKFYKWWIVDSWGVKYAVRLCSMYKRQP